MSKLLCIQWAVNNGKGYGSPYPESPEVTERLNKQIVDLKRAWPAGEFAVVEYPYAQPTYMPGPVASLVAARQLAR